ncbi:MAG: hypothetical protein ACE5HD_06505 [Acidobacteriota bacterium]
MSRRGWKKNLFLIGVAGLALVLLVVGGLAAALGWASLSYRSMGAPEPDTVQHSISLSPAPPHQPASGMAASKSGPYPADRSASAIPPPALAPLQVSVDLFEGHFEIRPGPPGSPVQVKGTYASSYYELVEESEMDPESGRRVSIRFQPKVGFLVRLIAGLTHISEGHPNQITVVLPRQTPTALAVRLGGGDSRIDLGGLTLTDLRVDLSKGSHRLEFGEPLRGDLPRMEILFQMGEGRVEKVGNAHPQELDISSRMGSFRVNLGGEWPAGFESQVRVTHSMGELVLLVPASIRVDRVASGSAPADRAPAPGEKTSEDPMIHLELSSSMGEARIQRY